MLKIKLEVSRLKYIKHKTLSSVVILSVDMED
jgi:hypothetical protein